MYTAYSNACWHTHALLPRLRPSPLKEHRLLCNFTSGTAAINHVVCDKLGVQIWTCFVHVDQCKLKDYAQ